MNAKALYPESKPAIECVTVHHYGPDPAYVGGMGSVIRVLTEHVGDRHAAVVHPMWRPNSKHGSAWLALKAAIGLPRLKATEVVHVHLAKSGSFIREGAIVVLARMLGKTTIATIHGSTFPAFAHRRPRLVSGVLRRAHVVTCLDPEVLALVRHLAPDVRSEIVPNPVDMDCDSPPADETDEIVLFAGEIGLRKGVDTLCRAWPLVAASRPDARCIVVGPVKDFSVPPLERLEILAPVDASGVRDLLRRARVVALPSQAEGMPMVLTEAMSSGRPFVSTPVGGIPELACHGGVLVSVGDDAGLAEAMVTFLADPQLARRLGESGRQFCSATRSVDVVDSRFCQLYRTARERD
jgi:glycosyltransferase involved in cell wall biosynthesis